MDSRPVQSSTSRAQAPTPSASARAAVFARAAAYALAAVLAAGLAGCGKRAQLAGADPLRTSIALVVEGEETAGDCTAWSGMLEEAREMKATVTDGNVTFAWGKAAWLEAGRPRLDGRDREQLADSFARRRFNLVMLPGADYRESAKRLAIAWPGTRFLVLDSMPVEGAPDNLATASFAVEEGAWLAATLASALIDASPGAIAFVGNRDDPQYEAWLAGWIAGLRASPRAAAGKTDFPVTFLSFDKDGSDNSERILSALGREGAVMALWAGGARQVDDRVLRAANQAGVTLVGAGTGSLAGATGGPDGNAGASGAGNAGASSAVNAGASGFQELPFSVRKRMDKACRAAIAGYMKNGSIKSAATRLGLAEGAIDLRYAAGEAGRMAPREAAVGSAREAIVKGTLKVPSSVEELNRQQAKDGR